MYICPIKICSLWQRNTDVANRCVVAVFDNDLVLFQIVQNEAVDNRAVVVGVDH